MPRLSISRAMAAVAIVAANCATLRAVLPEHGGLDLYEVFLVGLLPLFNAQIIGVYLLISTRYRISLRRRTARETVGFAPAFASENTLALVIVRRLGPTMSAIRPAADPGEPQTDDNTP